MNQDSTAFLRRVQNSAIALGALSVAGIAALMILSRGKGEDITGIVAPAILITVVSGIVSTVTGVLLRRARKAVDLEKEEL